MTEAAAPVPRPALMARVGPVGVALVALWALAGLGLVTVLAMSIDAERIALYGRRMFEGFVTTIEIVAMSFILGAAISIPVAAGRLSRNRISATLAYAYSYFFRGTPLIAQAFLIYYGAGEFASELRAIGLWGFFRDAFDCAVFAFAFNTAAYQAEILAGAIRAVPIGQREAALALGLHDVPILLRVVLPQALITALRPYGNEVILLIKASAITSIITVLDLMGETRYIFSRTYDLSFYLWAAVFYLVMVETLRRVWNRLEQRLTRHLPQSR
jgi:polar amino acid transport system permease protein